MNLEFGTGKPAVVAFYFPQFHRVDFNDEHHGEGFTEWDIVRRAQPLFPGHDQPRVPGDLGYYDLTHIDTYRRQVDLAQSHGIGGFCFYHYWFTGGRRLLERPFQQVLSSDIDFPFCLMWANHDWNMVFAGDRHTKTLEMTYAAQDPREFIADSLEALVDPRYIRVEGKPLLILYEIDGPPDLDDLVDGLRAEAIRQGAGDLFIAGVQIRPTSGNRYNTKLDALCEFPPHSYNSEQFASIEVPPGLDARFSGRLLDYRVMAATSVLRRNLVPDVNYFRTVVPDWDNTGRRMVRRDPWLYLNASTKLFEEWTAQLLADAAGRHDRTAPIVFVNAWNEWGEGAYLEPDQTTGSGRLEAISAAIERDGAASVDTAARLILGDRAEIIEELRPIPAADFAEGQLDTKEFRKATLWLDQLSWASAPRDREQVGVRGRWLRVTGFLVHPQLVHDLSHGHTLRIANEENVYEAMLPRVDRPDLLEKHGGWIDSGNLVGAGFDAQVSLEVVAPGRYQVEVLGGGHRGTVETELVVGQSTRSIQRQLPFRRTGFLHIQKTAGTSLVRMAREQGMVPLVSHGDFLRLSEARLEEAHLLSGHFGYDLLDRFADGRYLCTVLRDPVDRVISLYHFNRRQDPRKFPIYAMCRRLSFSEFIRSQEPLVKEHIDNHIVWSLSYGRYNRDDRQPWEVDIDRQTELAIQNLERFDRVAFVEHGNEGLRRIAQDIGLHVEEVPHVNAAPSRPAKAEVDQSDLDVLRERCAADMSLYEYARSESGES